MFAGRDEYFSGGHGYLLSGMGQRPGLRPLAGSFVRSRLLNFHCCQTGDDATGGFLRLYCANNIELAAFSQLNEMLTDACFVLQSGKVLQEKCRLDLQVERNLEGDISHNVPDFCIDGTLSSCHFTIDIAQYKLVRGLLEHNFGEQLEEFQRPMMSNLQEPRIHVSPLLSFCSQTRLTLGVFDSQKHSVLVVSDCVERRGVEEHEDQHGAGERDGGAAGDARCVRTRGCCVPRASRLQQVASDVRILLRRLQGH